jgi:hypothetical protein
VNHNYCLAIGLLINNIFYFESGETTECTLLIPSAMLLVWPPMLDRSWRKSQTKSIVHQVRIYAPPDFEVRGTEHRASPSKNTPLCLGVLIRQEVAAAPLLSLRGRTVGTVAQGRRTGNSKPGEGHLLRLEEDRCAVREDICSVRGGQKPRWEGHLLN